MILPLPQFTHDLIKCTTEWVKRSVVLNSVRFKVSYSPSAGLSESFTRAALDFILGNKNIWEWNWWIVNVSRNTHLFYPPFFQTDLPFTSSPVPPSLTSALFPPLIFHIVVAPAPLSSIPRLQHQRGLRLLFLFPSNMSRLTWESS